MPTPRICKICLCIKDPIKGVWVFKRGKPEGKTCLACSSKLNKERYRERHTARMREYYATDAGHAAMNEASRKYGEKPEVKLASKAYNKQWHSANPGKAGALYSRKRAAKLLRTVSWADGAKIAAFYAKARQLSKETGIVHHVDHIIPLQGKLVSGLHVETNLQVIPWFTNIKKKNKFSPGDA